mgnify:CR=1 FL=1
MLQIRTTDRVRPSMGGHAGLPARGGIGLKPQPAETGVGLTSMRSRAARIGGIITLGAGPLGGTRVTVTCARAEAATPA